MKIKKMKLSLISLVGLVVLLVPAFFVSAQESQEVSTSEQDVRIYVDGEPSYNESSREISLPVKVVNNTGKFLDDVYYEIEIYKGEALQEEGYLFEGLEYTGGELKKLGSIAPNEEKVYDFTYVHNEGIQTGSYFMKVFLVSEDGDNYAADFSKDSVLLKGNNYFVGSFGCVFRVGNVNYNPWLGWPFDSSISPEIVMTFGNDERVEIFEDEGFYIKSDIYERENSGELVREGKKTPVQIVEDGETELFVGLDTNEKVNFGKVAKDKLDGGLKPGTYRVTSTVMLDDNGKDIEVTAPCHSRWVVKGASGRIGDIETEKNNYSASDNFDMKVTVFGPPDDSTTSAELLAVVYDAGGNEIEKSSKNLDLGPEPAIADLSSISFRKNVTIGRVDLTLVGENGEEWDKTSFEYKTDSKEAGVLSKERRSLLIGALVVAGLIFLASFIYISIKKRESKSPMMFFVFASILFVGGYLLADACYPSGLNISITNDSAYCSGGTARWQGGIAMSAGNCLNYTNYSLSVNGSSLVSTSTGKYYGDSGGFSNGGKNYSACCWGYNSGVTSSGFDARAHAEYSGNPPKGSRCSSDASKYSSVSCGPPAPSLSLLANPTVINRNLGESSSNIRWYPSNATACGGYSDHTNNDGGWSTSGDGIVGYDVKAANTAWHNQVVSPLGDGVYRYSMRCTNSVGQAITRNADVTVYPVIDAPNASMNCSNISNPQANISWSSAGRSGLYRVYVDNDSNNSNGYYWVSGWTSVTSLNLPVPQSLVGTQLRISVRYNTTNEFSPITLFTPTSCSSVTASLVANPNTGTSPFDSTLTSTAGGATSGNITYEFDCTNDGIIDGTYTTASTTQNHQCNYSGAAGTRTANVNISNQGNSASAQALVTVNAPVYSCTGSLPVNTVGCSGDDTGLTADLPWVAVGTCTASRKCEASCSGGVCVYFDGSNCVNATGVCSGWNTGTCSGGTRTDTCNDNGSLPVPVSCGGTRTVPCSTDDPEYREVNP